MTLLAAVVFAVGLVAWCAGWERLCQAWDRWTEVPSQLDARAAARRHGGES